MLYISGCYLMYVAPNGRISVVTKLSTPEVRTLDPRLLS